MHQNFHIIIPARFQSTRLPGKLLMDIGGKTVLERVYLQALKAQARSIMIATDHEKIFETAKSFGADVIMTSDAHPTGTDRIVEVLTNRDYPKDDIVVNVQGDEPFIEPVLIQQAANILQQQKDLFVASLCWPIEQKEQLHNPNIVKVVRDIHQHAMYFSRQAIPFHRDKPECFLHVFRHIGLYAYRICFLLDKYQQLTESPLEDIEKLEQLRILEAGYKIAVHQALLAPKQDINTLSDLNIARSLC